MGNPRPKPKRLAEKISEYNPKRRRGRRTPNIESMKFFRSDLLKNLWMALGTLRDQLS